MKVNKKHPITKKCRNSIAKLLKRVRMTFRIIKLEKEGKQLFYDI
jgi:hypothetical protein